MKKTLPALMIAVILAVAGLTFTSCKKEKTNIEPTTTGVVNTTTAYEKQSLTFTREEEKMARDIYTKLSAEWPEYTFLQNIIGSEQKHMDAILKLLDKYGIEDPGKDMPEGIFNSADIRQMYDGLVAKGLKNDMDALIVGLTIEDMDIHDLEEAIKNVEKEDIKKVYSNLKRASQNHMREFHAQLKEKGGTYTPQYITQDEYNYIISTPKEHGGH